MDLRTYYLKYRPQRISDLDLPEIRDELGKVLSSGKVPPALLFSGPKGIGKTSAARIFAKAINCVGHTEELKNRKTKDDYEPCNECDICRGITEGTNVDLLEIDGASNRGIDDIRDLKDKIRLLPARSKYKVYIIDEVHMLTTEAFNALLKTLEEPPAHAVFILCTTEPQKIPATILSRCLRFNFRRGKVEEMVTGPLKRAVEGEGIKIEKGVLEIIAKAADGSFRDAHKILEQISIQEKNLTLEKVKSFLSQSEGLNPEKLLLLMLKYDLKASLEEINRVVAGGVDLTAYLRWMLEQLRLGLLVSLGVETGNGEIDWKIIGREKIVQLINLFSEATVKLKTAFIPQLPIELVIVEWIGDNLPRVEGQESRRVEGRKPTTGEEPAAAVVATTVNAAIPSGSLDLVTVVDNWPQLLINVKPLNHSLEALLKAARPLQIDGHNLTIEVFYKFHKERLETEKCRQLLEQVASELFGADIKLKCVLGDKKKVVASAPKDYSPEFVEGERSADGDGDAFETAKNIFS